MLRMTLAELRDGAGHRFDRGVCVYCSRVWPTRQPCTVSFYPEKAQNPVEETMITIRIPIEEGKTQVWYQALDASAPVKAKVTRVWGPSGRLSLEVDGVGHPSVPHFSGMPGADGGYWLASPNEDELVNVHV